MKLIIIKFLFTIIIFVCWSRLIQCTSIVEPIALSVAKDATKFPNLIDELLEFECENEPNSMNFNAIIPDIKQDFISSPLLQAVTCLNLADNYIENIEKGAFNKLTNLTQLFLSNNRFGRSELFNFGGHYNLKVLVMNNVQQNTLQRDITIRISEEYPNLEVLSLRKNFIYNLYFSPEKTSEKFSYTSVSTIMPEIPFPKLQALDLSKNRIRQSDLFKLLPNSLYILDLHDNLLSSLKFNKMNKLFALNLDNNNLMHITYEYNYYWPALLSMTGLKDLQYLSLSTNNIKIIESNAFQDNNQLLYLNLSKNNINYLHPDTFANLQNLKTLDLSINKLDNVPQILNKMAITTLYINHNNITKLMSHIFLQMPKLTKLLLGQNQINEIDVNAFTDLSDLEELDLSKNMLSSLPEGWTESLVSLKYLDLSDNQFTSLESLSLTSASSLIEVYLVMNPLKYLNVGYFESLPQNLTINLINISNFTKSIFERDAHECYIDS